MTAATMTIESQPRTALQLTLAGHVQGIGMRPAVARCAQQLSLSGYVGNTQEGVAIHVEGVARNVAQFELELRKHLPTTAEITSLRSVPVDPVGFDGFHVGDVPDADSSHRARALSALVPPDVVVCDDCLAEVRAATGFRHGYAFTSCTDCGPRFSIIERMPYERGQTSMAGFPLCDRCLGEYKSPTDRRFHAQTNACPQCGPEIWLRGAEDQIIARGHDALHAATSAVHDGRIVALRGLGGYQLLVDATSPEAVERLRQRKRRRGKPLAVMARSLSEAERLAKLDESEKRVLTGRSGPIVVAAARRGTPVAASVTAQQNTIGLMLPTTPLHWLLADMTQRPLVCTSGNRESEPLAYDADTALEQLTGIADVWLEHDRPIHRPIDDSVVRVIAGQSVTIRLARGLAPLTLGLESPEPLVALGGHQKTSIALCGAGQAVLGPHIGDLGTVAARERFTEQLVKVTQLYGLDDWRLVCDQHPEYFTTQWAENQVAPAVAIQHHHAHVVACMLERGWLDRQVLGVAFDGTGYGSDETIWGGEFLLSTATEFERVGHLRPFSLPGGERAVREPWRIATALVREAVGDAAAGALEFPTSDATSLLPVLQRSRLSPITTSVGRLFDGVAALVLGVERCAFEGEAAMLLESTCDLAATGQYEILSERRQLDWRPLIRQVLHDRAAGVSPGVMSMRFHRGLARVVFEFCRRFAPLPVVLGGGVFQNRVLVELVAEQLAATNQPLGLPGLIPPNDGGLAAGQLAIAAALAQRRRTGSCV